MKCLLMRQSSNKYLSSAFKKTVHYTPDLHLSHHRQNTPFWVSVRGSCAYDGSRTEGGAILGVWLQNGPVPEDPEVSANPRCWRVLSGQNIALWLSGRWDYTDDGQGTKGGAIFGVWSQNGPVPEDPKVPASPRCWRLLSRSAGFLSFLSFFILRACIHAIPRLRVLGWMLKHCWEGLGARSWLIWHSPIGWGLVSDGMPPALISPPPVDRG